MQHNGPCPRTKTYEQKYFFLDQRVEPPQGIDLTGPHTADYCRVIDTGALVEQPSLLVLSAGQKCGEQAAAIPLRILAIGRSLSA